MVTIISDGYHRHRLGKILWLMMYEKLGYTKITIQFIKTGNK